MRTPSAKSAKTPVEKQTRLIGAIRRIPEAAFSNAVYPLRDSFLLDTGADTHVCNNRDRLENLEHVHPPEYIRAGDSVVAIEGYGTLEVQGRSPDDEQAPIILHDVAYIPGYHTSLISHDVLREKSGAYLDGKHLLIRTADDAVFCTLTRLHRQLVVEYNEPSSSAYAIERSEAPPKKRTTARPKRSQVPLKASGTAEQWHLRLGHPGPEVIEHLPAEVKVLEP